MRSRVRILVAALVALMLALPAAGVEPGEILPDAALEARARALSLELRCLVCQNQSIDDSNAPLARDLRLLVRERLKAGDSDSAVLAFIVARYGEFVLLRPRFGWHTALLWLTPLLVLSAAVLGIALQIRRSARSQAEPAPLDRAEQARLAELLKVTRAPEP